MEQPSRFERESDTFVECRSCPLSYGCKNGLRAGIWTPNTAPQTRDVAVTPLRDETYGANYPLRSDFLCSSDRCNNYTYAVGEYWWSLRATLPPPPACRAGALLNELRPLFYVRRVRLYCNSVLNRGSSDREPPDLKDRYSLYSYLCGEPLVFQGNQNNHNDYKF